MISGNGGYGLYIADSGTANNLVAGNDVGVAQPAQAALPNALDGVDIVCGSASNTIGGTTAGARNIISGNGGDGVFIADPGTMNNLVAGDYAGIDATGTKAVPNGYYGVDIIDNASNNTVGGTTTAARNVISGNVWSGIAFTDAGTINNLAAGNDIGTDATGVKALPNGSDGVDIRFGASNNTIGGTTTGARNVISGNGNFGLFIADIGTVNNLVAGNYIGVDATGGEALRNAIDGVDIVYSASSNTIGGMAAGDRNVISGNGGAGLVIANPGTMNNLAAANYIGTDSTGASALGNASDGVVIVDGASSNTVGGTTAGARNVISGNMQSGVFISDAGTLNNVVAGNDVGTGATAPRPSATITTASSSPAARAATRLAGSPPAPRTSSPPTESTESRSTTPRRSPTLWMAITSEPTRPAPRPWATPATAFTSGQCFRATRSAARRPGRAMSSRPTPRTG